MMPRFAVVKDQVSAFDELGRVVFTVDRWLFEAAAARGDLARWLGAA